MVMVSDGGGDAGHVCGYGDDTGGRANNSGGEWAVVVMLVVMMGLMVTAVVMVTPDYLSWP